MDSVDRALIEMSAALADRPALRLGVEHGWFRDSEAIRRRAAEMIAEIPHPPGHRTASSLAWGEGEQMSSLSEGDIQLLVQANAMCDWLHHALERAEGGEVPPVVGIVLRHLPHWPAMRGGRMARDLQAAVDATEAGDLSLLRELGERCRRRPEPAVQPSSSSPTDA